MKFFKIIIIIIFFGSSLYLYPNVRSKTKKLIHTGWEMPYPQFIRDSLSVIESQPFIGMALLLKFPNHDVSYCVFSSEKVLQTEVQDQIDIIKNIKWKKFTDNFLWVFSADIS